MPIHRVDGGEEWGNHGKIYRGPGARAKAARQAAAAHANGYTGDEAHAAGFAVQAPNGELLFMKRSAQSDHAGTWCFPGGGIEQGEDAISAAQREFNEETGYTEAGYFSGDPIDERDGFVTFGLKVPKPFQPKLNDEHTAFVWATPADAPRPLHPGVAATLRTRTDQFSDAAATTRMSDFAGHYAPERIGDTRRMTPEGFMLCPGVGIARAGTQVYRFGEIKGLKDAGNGEILVDRPEDEVFDQETMASFEGKPVTIGHPPDDVDPNNWAQHAVGTAQNIRRGTGDQKDLLIADLLITRADGIRYVDEHLPEISAGYKSSYSQREAGKATQFKIRGNHVALVERGRAGTRVSTRDQHQSEIVPMTTKILRAALAAVGLSTPQVETVERIVDAAGTRDASAESDSDKMKRLESENRDMKAAMDARTVKDAAAETERKETERKAADKRAADAAAEEDRQKSEDAARRARDESAEAKKKEAEEAEKTGDTLIEAESPGTVIKLGQVYTGDALSTITANAEVLSPGISLPTRDSIKGTQGRALATFMRTALTKAMTTDAGAAAVKTFAGARTVDSLKGEALVHVFNGSAELVKVVNNKGGAGSQATRDSRGGQGQKIPTISEINAANRANAKTFTDAQRALVANR